MIGRPSASDTADLARAIAAGHKAAKPFDVLIERRSCSRRPNPEPGLATPAPALAPARTGQTRLRSVFQRISPGSRDRALMIVRAAMTSGRL